ncbi:hypothetical protein ACP4OV_015367 [Aristida adscensionis]
MSKVSERNSFDGTKPVSSASPTTEPKKHDKTIPHYLRASTGSCHDLCKYGHRSLTEEETKFSGGRRKKLPTPINNLTLHRSAILDRSKDVKHRSLSLAKSSISLGEAERVAPKITSANKKVVASNKHLVPRTSASVDHKIVISDGRKKHSVVAQKAPTNTRYSSGLPNSDKKATMPVKASIVSAKSKLSEKTVPEKSKTVGKATMAKQSLLKRPASSPTKINMIKQVSAPSQASGHTLLSSKDIGNRKGKGKGTSPSATIARMPAKSETNPTKSSNSNIGGKVGSDMSGPSFSMDPKLITSAEIQDLSSAEIQDLPSVEPNRTCLDHDKVTGYYVESTQANWSSSVMENVDTQPAVEETSKSISDVDEMGRAEASKALASEVPLESTGAPVLQQSHDDQEFNAALGETDPKHKLAVQSVLDDWDNQTDDAFICQLSEQLKNMGNTDASDPLTKSDSNIEDDRVKAYAHVESLIHESKEECGAHEDLQRSPKLALDGKHSEGPESCLDLVSGNAAENDKADEVLDARINKCASHSQPISEISSDAELLEEPKCMLIEPSDSTVQTDAAASVSNENSFEQEGLKPRVFIPQSPEELSDDEFYEEYDFELSDTDESGTEDEEATINRNKDDSLKAGNRRPRRTSELELDGTSSTPYKLKFKRGKIVELPPDSSGPKRLRFRRKAANEVSNVENQPTRRVYKRNSANTAVPAYPDEESPGVKLRHQDTQEKKDAQGLFNNVIEETASKLVESRKSKVKALVGAFETVISLQDGKPTSSTPQAGNSQDSVHGDEGYAPEEAE